MEHPESSDQEAHSPIIGVSTCLRHQDRFLLIQRGKAPNKGLWSLPGGHVRHGETLREAAARELLEETTVTAEIGAVVDVLDIFRRDVSGDALRHYVVVVFQGLYLSGEPVAGDDAANAAWVSMEGAHTLPRTDTLLSVLRKAETLFTRV